MEPLSTALLLVHPFLALLIVLWLVRQHGWRKGGGTLKGEARREALAEHVRSGERLLVATVGLVLVAVLARAAAGYIEEGRITAMLLPTNLHGWTGPLGLWVLWTTVRNGRRALAAMENKESIVAPRTRHGRAADLMLILVGIHAFLGFLYTFAVLS
ncbi:MAG: hypothetical protein CMB41_03295 [Euryarchaeota archaeon]|nr:hypothetical protein [Euryarchaeota archaeon]|tara:strand:- start:104 stop:574 length:471 start_codon:yes stop_codon:yes gene_type:complete